MKVEDITPLKTDAPVGQVLEVCLNNMGFTDASDVTPGACFVLKRHLETCPTCRLSHAMGSHYLIETFINDCYTVRNVEQHCRSRLVSIEHMVEQHTILKRILENPRLDSPLADLYVAEKGCTMAATARDVYRFGDGKWVQLAAADLDNDVRSFMEDTVSDLLSLLLHEEHMLTKMNATHDSRGLQDLRKKLQKALEVARNQVKRGQIVKTVRNQLHDGLLHTRWDSVPELFGMERGVLNLDTGMYRDADKEDYITMSCGYDWAETVDPEMEAEVETFIAKVYPVEEEREFMQRYCYYCHLGVHRSVSVARIMDLKNLCFITFS